MTIQNRERLARKVKKIRKKPQTGNRISLVSIVIILAVIAGGIWLYRGFFPGDIRLNYIVITKNNNPLKILHGETVKFHPSDVCKISEVSTNIFFNQGIRIVSAGINIDNLIYEETALEKVLPDQDIFKRYQVTVEVKYDADVVGKIELVIEPDVKDWIDKATGAPDLETRVGVLEDAINKGFNDPKIVNMLVDEYQASKAWKKASDLLEKIAAESQKEEDLKKLLKVYEDSKNNNKTADVINRLIKINPDDLTLRYKLAELYEKSGKRDDAVSEYKMLLTKVPAEEQAFIYKTLGYLFSESKQTKNAITAYLKALEIDKDDVNLYYNLSGLYENTGEKANAEKYLAMALDKKPEDIESRLKMAEGLISKKDYKKAEEYLREVTKVRPDYVDAWLMFAGMEEKRGNKKALKEYYKKIISLTPGNKTVLFNLGALEYETGNQKEAKDYFLKYLKVNPSDMESREFLFEIYRKEKNNKSAFEHASKIIEKNPEKKQYYSFIFDYLNGIKDYKTMSRVMDEGLKKHPDDMDITKYLIIARLNTGKEKEAVSLIEGYIKKKPNDVQTLMQLAKLYEKLGLLKDAVGIYKKVLDLSPDNEEAQESYLRLRMEVL